MKKMTDKAHAKLNLMLNISGVREDGYHTVETVMQTVSLADLVEVTLRPKKGIELFCNVPYIPRDGRNIAWKAADRFMEKTGLNSGAAIAIRKVIPVGAGMAGGSADAAAVLRILNTLCGMPLTGGDMQKLAAGLGADVPFCLHKGTYLGTGMGEVLSPLPNMPPCIIVVCKPKVSVSTKVAYQLTDEYPNPLSIDYRLMVAALEGGRLADVCRAMGNTMEGPIAARHPEIRVVKERLIRHGAINAMMTGSGSGVFGVFDDLRKAERIKTMLMAGGYRAYCLSPVSE